MTPATFNQSLQELIATAEIMRMEAGKGKGEENRKDRLLEPLLEALGYSPEYRTLEGSIRSLLGTTTWVDYFLRQEVGK